MKKAFKTMFFAVLAAALMLFAFAACDNPANQEVAGTYELTSVSGNVNGVTISKNSYEYFRIILEANGNGTVQSKPAGVGAAKYEAKGTYVYEDGKIKMTTRNGSQSVTEEYDYADGVITYKVDTQGMKFTIKLTKVVEEKEEKSAAN